MADVKKQQRELAEVFGGTAGAAIFADHSHDSPREFRQQTPIQFSATINPEHEAAATYHILENGEYRTLPEGRKLPDLAAKFN